MALPPHNKPYAFKDLVDRAVDQFVTVQNPTQADLNRVEIAGQLQHKLNEYRAAAKRMSLDELETERHNSTRLAQFLGTSGQPRPHPLCDAHAVISGAHAHAAKMRAVLAWFQRRIDDPVNGCWLPRNTAARQQMPGRLKNAVPHSRIHRKNYYQWLNTLVNMPLIRSDDMLVQSLKMITLKLQDSSFPDYVMLPADRTS